MNKLELRLMYMKLFMKKNKTQVEIDQLATIRKQLDDKV